MSRQGFASDCRVGTFLKQKVHHTLAHQCSEGFKGRGEVKYKEARKLEGEWEWYKEEGSGHVSLALH
jgi:hypothetical protein